MGDILDVYLDGTLCQVCGAVFDDITEGEDPPGYPRTCDNCKEEEEEEEEEDECI